MFTQYSDQIADLQEEFNNIMPMPHQAQDIKVLAYLQRLKTGLDAPQYFEISGHFLIGDAFIDCIDHATRAVRRHASSRACRLLEKLAMVSPLYSMQKSDNPVIAAGAADTIAHIGRMPTVGRSAR